MTNTANLHHLARNLHGAEVALAFYRSMLDSMTIKAEAATQPTIRELMFREADRYRSLIAEYEADLDDCMDCYVEAGGTPERYERWLAKVAA